jgi:hypothetical protein
MGAICLAAVLRLFNHHQDNTYTYTNGVSGTLKETGNGSTSAQWYLTSNPTVFSGTDTKLDPHGATNHGQSMGVVWGAEELQPPASSLPHLLNVCNTQKVRSDTPAFISDTSVTRAERGQRPLRSSPFS